MARRMFLVQTRAHGHRQGHGCLLGQCMGVAKDWVRARLVAERRRPLGRARAQARLEAGSELDLGQARMQPVDGGGATQGQGMGATCGRHGRSPGDRVRR